MESNLERLERLVVRVRDGQQPTTAGLARWLETPQTVDAAGNALPQRPQTLAEMLNALDEADAAS